MPNFDDLNSLFKHIEKMQQDVMRNEVADVAREQVCQSVENSVYDAYTPKSYTRRRSYGGLSDTRNINVYEIEDGIEVVNDAPLDWGGNDPRLDEIIVYGEGKQPFPRDFYQDAAESLDESKAHVEAMKEGLRKRGVKVD